MNHYGMLFHYADREPKEPMPTPNPGDWAAFWSDLATLIHSGQHNTSECGFSGSWFKGNLLKLIGDHSKKQDGNLTPEFLSATHQYVKTTLSALNEEQFLISFQGCVDFCHAGYANYETALDSLKGSLISGLQSLGNKRKEVSFINIVTNTKEYQKDVIVQESEAAIIIGLDLHESLARLIKGSFHRGVLRSMLPPDSGSRYTESSAAKWFEIMRTSEPNRSARTRVLTNLYQGAAGSQRWLIRRWLEMNKET